MIALERKGMCHQRAAISVCYEGGALRSVRVSCMEETTLSPQLLWVMSGNGKGMPPAKREIQAGELIANFHRDSFFLTLYSHGFTKKNK